MLLPEVICSVPCVPAQLVLVEDHADPRSGRQVHVEVFEAQRLCHQILGEDLWPKMLATPFQLAERGEYLEMRRGADGTLKQAAAIELDSRSLGHRRDLPHTE